INRLQWVNWPRQWKLDTVGFWISKFRTSEISSFQFPMIWFLLCQRIRPQLKFDDFAGGAFTGVGMERRASGVRRPQTLALPAGPGVVNTAVEAFCVEAERIGNGDIHPLANLQGQQAAVLISSGDRRVSAQSECIELADPRVVAGFRTSQIFRTFDWRARHGVQRPAFGTMLAGCCRAIDRPLT